MPQKQHKLIGGMDEETARRYLDTREKIQAVSDRMYAIASLLALFQKMGDERISIEPSVISHFGKEMTRDVCLITSLLEDDFASESQVDFELIAHLKH